jgi:hypothetical protein
MIRRSSGVADKGVPHSKRAQGVDQNRRRAVLRDDAVDERLRDGGIGRVPHHRTIRHFAQPVRAARDADDGEAIGGELRCDGSAEQATRADNDRDSITHGIDSLPVPLRAEGTFAPRRQSAGLHRICHCPGFRTIR